MLEPPFLKYLNIKTPAVAMTAAAKPANIQYDVTLSALGPQRCLRGIKKIKCLFNSVCYRYKCDIFSEHMPLVRSILYLRTHCHLCQAAVDGLVYVWSTEG